MHKILKKQHLAENIIRLDIFAPIIARSCRAGQFVIVRAAETGERIPLTIADYNREQQSISLIFQIVGKSTTELSRLNEGGSVQDVAGPLGKASELSGYKKVTVIGGGLGCAIALPQAKELYSSGSDVTIIAGFRSRELIILENEMKSFSRLTYIMTDDGSSGEKGLVTDKLRTLIENGEKFDAVIAIGPLPMMKFVSRLTAEYGIKTIVSMNPIMIDGTGMCGGCRLTVDGKMKFACVDGPDFDGHSVDFDEVIRRNAVYSKIERQCLEDCRLFDQSPGTNVKG